eukprot:gb/GEZN01015225.1/.p1 GENE.gb/GEZN01015225.1/~~gb/GEZN01015225.1/.p1  ORF type:complete len:134 (+),score=12.07 gb/GEZN01015225.1/:36-437(+)
MPGRDSIAAETQQRFLEAKMKLIQHGVEALARIFYSLDADISALEAALDLGGVDQESWSEENNSNGFPAWMDYEKDKSRQDQIQVSSAFTAKPSPSDSTPTWTSHHRLSRPAHTYESSDAIQGSPVDSLDLEL